MKKTIANDSQMNLENLRKYCCAECSLSSPFAVAGRFNFAELMNSPFCRRLTFL